MSSQPLPGSKQAKSNGASSALAHLYDEASEKNVLGCMLIHPQEVVPLAADRLLASDFFVPAHQTIFRTILDLVRENEPVEMVLVHQRLADKKQDAEVGSPGILAELATSFATRLTVGSYIDRVAEAATWRKLAESAESIASMVRQQDVDLPTAIERAKYVVTSAAAGQRTETIEPHRFDIDRAPTRTEPVLWLGDAGVAKPGDLVVLQAQVKSGKSSLLAAMMGCLIGDNRDDCDFLGVRGNNPDGLPVLHIDTEQTPEDHYDMIMRTLHRAKLNRPPEWFYSYCLVELTIDQRRKALQSEIDRLMKLHGALAAIFLDGAADLVHDVNDPAEANGLVDELYSSAIRCRGPLVSVVHENHGQDSGKQRGHLGSQMMRKAASNLRLDKDSNTGVIQVWGEKLRRGHIAKGTGPHFVWSEEHLMHLSCESDFETKKRDEITMIRTLINQVFSGRGAVKYGDLVKLVMEAKKVKDKTAQKTVSKMLPFLSKSEFGYMKS